MAVLATSTAAAAIDAFRGRAAVIFVRLFPGQRIPVGHRPARPVRIPEQESPFKGNFFRFYVIRLLRLLLCVGSMHEATTGATTT